MHPMALEHQVLLELSSACSSCLLNCDCNVHTFPRAAALQPDKTRIEPATCAQERPRF